MTSKARYEPTPEPGRAPTLRGQVREALRQRIHAGEWRTGDRLPSESELIEAHAVSRITVRQALADLAAEGMIERVQGKGSFVAPGPVRQELSRLQGLSEALGRQGRAVRTQVLAWRRERPDAAQRTVLGLAAGEQCMALRTLRYADDEPLSFNCSWVASWAAEGLTRQALADSDLLTLYEGRKAIRVARAVVDISATLASAEQCRLLGLSPPAALLQVERTVYALDGRPLHRECSVYAPQAFSYRIELDR
jgi:GntR family transcriptional regulator